MSKNYAVKFKNVSKIYTMNKQNESSENISTSFYALKDISFEIPKGEAVGILGTNGSGKSTLSRILAGIATPDEGEVDIVGEQALIAINSGLNGKLTGLENIELKGVLLGFSRKRIKEITELVIEFSELGDFIHQPVKKYSSGMKARLGFSISINIDPDIIIVDEALSVGDSTFTQKCLNKINELKESGKTIFFVSHSVGEMKRFSQKGLWIEGGVLKAYDDIEKVARDYETYIAEYKKKSKEEQKQHREAIFNNRITTTSKKTLSKKIKAVAKHKKIVGIGLGVILLMTSCIGAVVMYKNFNGNDTIAMNNSITQLQENKSYVFISRDKVSSNDYQYRDYIDDSKPRITDITEVTFSKDGYSVSLTKIPVILQYYYESEGISDELSYYYQFENNDQALLKYLEKVTDKKISGIYEIDKNQLTEMMNIVDIDVKMGQNENVWTVDGKDIMISNDDYPQLNKEEYISLMNSISNNLKELNKEEQNKYLELLYNDDKSNEELTDIVRIFIKNWKNNEVKTSYDNIKLDKTRVGSLLSPNTIVNNIDLINEDLVYIDGLVDLQNNIFVKRYNELTSPSVMNSQYNSIQDSNNSSDSNVGGMINTPSNNIGNNGSSGSNMGNENTLGNGNNAGSGSGSGTGNGNSIDNGNNAGNENTENDNSSDNTNPPSTGEDAGDSNGSLGPESDNDIVSQPDSGNGSSSDLENSIG